MSGVWLKKVSLCAAILLMAGLNSHAQNTPCSNVDLRTNTALNVVRNQGGLGWCYAYATADIYGHALNRRISAFDIAVNYYRTHSEFGIQSAELITRLKGGRSHEVLESALTYGLCPDLKVSSFRQNAPASLVEIERLANIIGDIRATGEARRDSIVQLVLRNFLLLNQIFPTSTYNELRAAFLNFDPHEKPLATLFDNICGDRISVSHLDRRAVVNRPSEQMIQFARQQLRQGRPLLIGYHSQNLKHPIQQFEELNHASTIVGMRQFRGRCEYLLKNSWGEFNPKNYHVSLHNVFSADRNYVWIPESMFGNMAKLLEWVVPRY